MNEYQWTLESPHWWLSHYPKEPNYSHHQSTDLGYVPQVHSTNQVEKGSRRELLEMSSGLESLIWECWLSDYWFLRGLASLLCTVPSFAFKHTFWAVLLRSFRQSFMRWSGLPHLKQFWFFLRYSLNCIDKMDNMSYWWICFSNSTSRFLHLLQLKTQPLLPFLPLHAQVFFSFSAFHYSGSSSKGMSCPSSFLEGNKFPGVYNWVYIWYSSCGGLWEQRILWLLPSCPTTGLQGAGQNS